MYAPSIIIKRIKSTKTIAAPEIPLLQHIINHPPFCLFTLLYGFLKVL